MQIIAFMMMQVTKETYMVTKGDTMALRMSWMNTTSRMARKTQETMSRITRTQMSQVIKETLISRSQVTSPSTQMSSPISDMASAQHRTNQWTTL